MGARNNLWQQSRWHVLHITIYHMYRIHRLKNNTTETYIKLLHTENTRLLDVKFKAS